MKRFAILALGTLMLGLPAAVPTAFAQSAPEAAPSVGGSDLRCARNDLRTLPGDGKGRDERGRRGAIGRRELRCAHRPCDL